MAHHHAIKLNKFKIYQLTGRSRWNNSHQLCIQRAISRVLLVHQGSLSPASYCSPCATPKCFFWGLGDPEGRRMVWNVMRLGEELAEMGKPNFLCKKEGLSLCTRSYLHISIWFQLSNTAFGSLLEEQSLQFKLESKSCPSSVCEQGKLSLNFSLLKSRAGMRHPTCLNSRSSSKSTLLGLISLLKRYWLIRSGCQDNYLTK